MKVLVTGGAGFIGSHVADELLRSGHDVVIVDDLSTGARANLNPAARFVELDIRSPELEKVFAQERPDAVAHLAAQINVTASVEDPSADAAINVLGTIGLLEQACKYDVQRFIFSSTGGAIYGSPETLPATEQTVPAPLSPYAVSKLACEEYVKLYGRTRDLPFVILRYTNVFGPRQIPHGECGVCAVLTDLMMQGKEPILYGFGEPVRDYVYAGDVAKANLLALEKGTGETLNIASGHGTTVMEIFEALKKALDFEGEPQLKALRAGEVEKIFCANDKAAEALGWHPAVDLDSGLRNVVEHFRQG